MHMQNLSPSLLGGCVCTHKIHCRNISGSLFGEECLRKYAITIHVYIRDLRMYAEILLHDY